MLLLLCAPLLGLEEQSTPPTASPSALLVVPFADQCCRASLTLLTPTAHAPAGPGLEWPCEELQGLPSCLGMQGMVPRIHMALEAECRPLGVFECQLCSLTAPYSYVGQQPPDTQSVVLLEESYVMRDPFTADKGRFLILGSRCSLCGRLVCVGPVALETEAARNLWSLGSPALCAMTAGSTLMVEAPGTCCNASLSLTLTMSTEAQPAVRAPLKVPIGRTTVYGLQRVQSRVRLCLLDDLHQLRVLRDQLPQVCQFLEEFWEEEDVVRMVALQVEPQNVHNALLHFLNVSHIQEAGPIYPRKKEKTPECRDLRVNAE
ncbi:hypothetical protein CB1_000279021 [Camelus ferus]|nr:hypothetical protein CB1_000279021 [Camelus ferus]